MKDVRGVDWGSYIWGQSAHNICIERLWVDVTDGFGWKWKDLFQTLEAQDGLDVNSNAHLWLLHFLFLPMVNNDAGQWAAAWNSHVFGCQGEPHHSSQHMFVQGIIENGHRSSIVHPPGDDMVDNIVSYGIDWDDIDNSHLHSHHDTHNIPDEDGMNPFVSNQPTHLSHVDVPNPHCPFTVEQMQSFQYQLDPLLNHNYPSNAHSYSLLWIQALEIASSVI
ncbi:hypothetical protein BDR07DRAFT_1281509 [Suillus spraguei]|nr:hypothetical protein BDR07DRAFT_1281509 [Suillus spraguei]